MTMLRSTLEQEAKAKGGKYEKSIYTTFMEYARECDMRPSEALRELDMMVDCGMAEELGNINASGIGLNSMATVTTLYVLFPPEEW